MAEKYGEAQNQTQVVKDKLVEMFKKDFIVFRDTPSLYAGGKEERDRFFNLTAESYVRIRRENPATNKQTALRTAMEEAIRKGDFAVLQNPTLQDAPGMLWGSKPVGEKIKELP